MHRQPLPRYPAELRALAEYYQLTAYTLHAAERDEEANRAQTLADEAWYEHDARGFW